MKNKFIALAIVSQFCTSGALFADAGPNVRQNAQKGQATAPTSPEAHGQHVYVDTQHKAYTVTPNQVVETVNPDGSKSYTFSGTAGIKGKDTTYPYSRTVTVTKTGTDSYTVNGTINQSASGRVPAGTTYTQTISKTSTGYSILGTSSMGAMYTVTVTWKPTESGVGGDYVISGVYNNDGKMGTIETLIPSTKLDPAEVVAKFDPEVVYAQPATGS